MGEIVAFRNRDGSREFECHGCQHTIHQFVDAEQPALLCLTCSFIDSNPDLPEEMKARLRGRVVS